MKSLVCSPFHYPGWRCYLLVNLPTSTGATNRHQGASGRPQDLVLKYPLKIIGFVSIKKTKLYFKQQGRKNQI